MKKKENFKPNGLATFVYTTISKCYCFFKGWKVDRSELKAQMKRCKEQNKGCLLLYNHSGHKDHFVMTSALNGHKNNCVLTKYFYYDHFIATVTSWVKAIYKDQFKPDLQSIRNMKRALDRPGIVSIAPTGQVTEDGGENFVSHSIVKLIRFCKTDVLGLVTYGMHFAHPKWAKNKRNTKVTAKFIPLIKHEELATLTDDEIYERIYKIASVNLQDYQEEHKNIIKGKNLVEGLENSLYMCPKCHKVHTMTSSKDAFVCSSCGNSFRYNNYGFLVPAPDAVGFTREDHWNRFQLDEMKKKIKEDNYSIEHEFEMLRNINKDNVLDKCGKGIIHLAKDAFYFDGELNGEPYHKDFMINSIFQLPHSTGKYFFIPDDEGAFKFYPTKRTSVVYEYVQFIDALREIAEEDEGKVF